MEESTADNARGAFEKHFQILRETVREARRDQTKDLAAAIAYWTLFSIFPLLLGILAVAGFYLETEEVRARLMELVIERLPGSAEMVTTQVESVVAQRGKTSLAALLGLFWSASKGFGAVTRTLNRALDFDNPSSAVVTKLRHFAMTIVVSTLLVAVVAVTVYVEIALGTRLLTNPEAEGLTAPWFVNRFLNLLLLALLFALIYRLAPYVKVRWRDVWPGAVLAAVLVELAKVGFVFYLDRIANFESIYGPLTSMIVLLLWLYASARAVLLGAEYNYIRARVRQGTLEI